MGAARVDIQFFRKDSATIRAIVKDGAGARLDLTGAAMRLVVKLNRADLDAAAVIPAKDITETLTANGQILDQSDPTTKGMADFFILHTETPSLSLFEDGVKYWWGIKLKPASGTEYYTIGIGRLLLEQEIVSEAFA